MSRGMKQWYIMVFFKFQKQHTLTVDTKQQTLTVDTKQQTFNCRHKTTDF